MRLTKRLREPANPRERGDAAEFEVGFVDEDGGFGGGFEDEFDIFERDAGAGGVVRAGDHHRFGFGAQGFEKLVDGEGEIAFLVLQFAYGTAGDFGIGSDTSHTKAA